MAVAFRSEQSSPAGAFSPRDHLFSARPWSAGSERATAAGEARRHTPAAWRRTQKQRRARSTPPSAGGCNPWERHAARRLVLRAFRATAPAELQELLRDEGVAAPDDPVMQELAPLVAAVQTLPPVTRQQLQQLWQATLQLVQGGTTARSRLEVL